MRSIVKVMAATAVALSFALAPAAPVSAQSITFSVSRPAFPFIMWPHVTVRPRGNVAVRFGSDMPRWVRTSQRERCEDRYRSYDPWTNTYLGYDGDRHFCRL